MDQRDKVPDTEFELVERVVGVGDALQVGRYRYLFATRRWE